MAGKAIKQQEINWDFIADKIRNGQCVLVLGPEVYTASNGTESCGEALIRHLNIPENPNIYRYYAEDEFFLFDESYKRTLICHEIKSFYESQQPNAGLEALARIPFHIYLTVTPDALLQQAFENQSFTYQAGYYKRNKEPQPIKAPSKGNPLIYNVFGSVLSEESIILSHDDLYDYFKSTFAQRSIPEKLKIRLQDVKNFIFLGVPFDKWYMQLLLRELEIHNRKYEFTRFAASQEITERLSTFCLDQFQIQFISQNISRFIQELLGQFAEEELRRPDAEASSGTGRAKRFLAEGELEMAIEELENCTEGTELAEDTLQLSGRYGKFKRRVIRGILSPQDQALQENNISNDLMTLVGEAEKLGL